MSIDIDGSLGPGYDYWKSIKSPEDMGMSGGPSIRTLANDVGGLISYVEVLVTGDSDASKTGEPLGNKFFLKSISTCRNIMANKNLPDSESNPLIVPRYIYVDNVPDGTIPFITQGADGAKLNGASGLIPGALGNLTAFSPSGFGRAFSMGNHPDCMPITLRTIDNDNNHGQETHFVAVSDIVHEIKNSNVVGGKAVSGIDPCRFTDYTNPSDGKTKTKAECNPGSNQDSFSSMTGSGRGNASFEASSDSESVSSDSSDSSNSSDSSSSSNHKDKPKSKHKPNHAPPRKNRIASSDKQYDDIMSIHNDTMFDDVSISKGSGSDILDTKTAVLTAYRLPEDALSRVYYAAIAGIGLYLLYRVMKKYIHTAK